MGIFNKNNEDSSMNRHRRRSSEAIDRKSLQLCRQVERTLHQALADAADDMLRDLSVESVQPAPSSRRLLVVVSPLAGEITSEDAIQRLQQAAGYLRSCVASAINRRRTPELEFCFIPETV